MNTLNYSEQIKAFQSVVGISPKFYLEFSNMLFYIDDAGVVNLVSDPAGVEYNQAFVRTVINDDFHLTKVFDNVEIHSTVDNKISVGAAKFHTSNQSSDIATMVDFDKREDTYKLSIPRDGGIGRMRGKYLISDYDIKGGTDGTAFSIPYIKTRYRYSKI